MNDWKTINAKQLKSLRKVFYQGILLEKGDWVGSVVHESEKDTEKWITLLVEVWHCFDMRCEIQANGIENLVKLDHYRFGIQNKTGKTIIN